MIISVNVKSLTETNERLQGDLSIVSKTMTVISVSLLMIISVNVKSLTA